MNVSRRIFLAEVREQPAALLTLLEQLDVFVAAGRACAARKPSAVRLVGHGSSDAAASYGVYAFGLLPGWTALRDSISLSVYYGAELDFSSSVVIGLSQSGQTPDVVSYVERARERGALTIALTNDPGSALAERAELTLPLEAGEEQSVAASKTFFNELAALALLAGSAAGREDEIWDGLRRTAVVLADAIPELEKAVAPLAMAFAYVGRMYVIGRGYELATAREIALKLTETCRVAAEPLTSTDLAHGPVAALDSMFPVWTIASPDATLPALIDAAKRVREAGATLVACGSAAAEVEGAAWRLPVPEAPVPLLSPLLSVVPGQLFAAALAEAKGLDPDKPERLTKVTLAQ
ncbi:MAG: SIS domain-containing protein [Actinobacteria bacterium]|nr:MAG: SIS domain-containing protein [Actinomycetota bacterium]